MPVIESDMELYLGFQSPEEDCDDYMAMFKARVDTINTHGSFSRKYPGHFSETFSWIQTKQDTGLCNRVPYIDMRKYKEVFALVKTMRKNFEGYTKQQMKQAILARKAQAIVAHTTNDKFK